MRITAIVLLLFLAVSNCAGAEFDNTNTAAGLDLPLELLDQLSVQKINHFINEVNNELDYSANIPKLDAASLKEIALNGLEFDWHIVSSAIVNYLFKEFVLNLHLMGKLIFLAVLCSLLKNLQSSFEDSSVSLIAYSVCFIFLSVVAINAFYQGISLASATVGRMVGFMEALLPLMLSLLAGVGAVATAALFTPLMLMVVSVMSQIVKNVVLPLLFLAAVLECVNYLTGKYKLSNLSSFLKQSAMVVLGFSMMLFIGITSIQGVAGSVADGLALRTAKYAASTFIPVLGKMFSDTVELMMGASLLLKSAVGIFGVMAVGLLCIMPLLKLISVIMVIKISGAIIQPMGDEKMAQCLNTMGNNLLLVFGSLLTVALMFFLTITMIVGMGNMALMLK